MGKRWYMEHRRDPYYRKAKAENYRSRAAYKLKQIQKRYNVIRRGDVVIDLGASPGGWSQVALELVGGDGLVIGVDLEEAPPLEGWIFIRGDVTREETRKRITEELKKRGKEHVTVVLSDMSPNISGNYSLDQARSAYLASIALEFSASVLRPGGCMVCKIFQGEDTPPFIEEAKRHFRSVRRYSPPASRKSSSEVYIVAKGKKSVRDEG